MSVVEAGGLMSYGGSFTDHRRVLLIVHRKPQASALLPCFSR